MNVEISNMGDLHILILINLRRKLQYASNIAILRKYKNKCIYTLICLLNLLGELTPTILCLRNVLHEYIGKL